MMRRMLINVAFLMIAMWGAAAHADIISGDFRTESNLPDFDSLSGWPTKEPKVYQNLGAAVGAGVELTSFDFLANPSGWIGGVVSMDLDPLTKILTLDSQDFSDFQTFSASIANMLFSENEIITGISLIGEDSFMDRTITPLLSFTSDSILISYDYTYIEPSDAFFFRNGTATFQLTTAVITAPVPEPEIYAMMGIGLGLMGWVGRRRKQQVA